MSRVPSCFAERNVSYSPEPDSHPQMILAYTVPRSNDAARYERRAFRKTFCPHMHGKNWPRSIAEGTRKPAVHVPVKVGFYPLECQVTRNCSRRDYAQADNYPGKENDGTIFVAHNPQQTQVTPSHASEYPPVSPIVTHPLREVIGFQTHPLSEFRKAGTHSQNPAIGIEALRRHLWLLFFPEPDRRARHPQPFNFDAASQQNIQRPPVLLLAWHHHTVHEMQIAILVKTSPAVHFNPLLD